MFRLLLRIGILAVMMLALAIPKVDARAAPANAAALASQRRALLSVRPPRNERRASSRLRRKACSTCSASKWAVGADARRGRVAARARTAIPRYRDSARALRSRVWRQRGVRRVDGQRKKGKRLTLPPAASSSNSLRDVRPAVRVRQPHAGRGEQAELRRGLRVTVGLRTVIGRRVESARDERRCHSLEAGLV